jgi:DNA helicase MCM8
MRADLIFILLDRPDESHDRLISEHIMNSHSAGSSHPYTASSSGKRNRGAWEAEAPHTGAVDSGSFTLQQRLRWKIQEALRASRSADLRGVVQASGVVSVELMRRYIEYAKQYVHPHLSPGAAKVLQRLYLTMRSEASAGQSIPVTTRHLESLIRLSQARARVDLREEVGALLS